MSEEHGPNAEQIKYWNEISGPKWVALDDVIESQITGIGMRAIDRANVQSGERILDVGCGCGHTALELAKRTGSAGRVTGMDISGPMLESARQRIANEGVKQAEFVQADAQTYAFEPEACDLVFSRFGVMFFADPVAAFANLRSALRETGRIAFVCWQELGKNPWIAVPTVAAAQHVELPGPPAPNAPGPFAFADRERVEGILEAAGFTQVKHESIESDLMVGGGMDLEATIQFLMQMGPAGALLREASQTIREAATDSIREALRPFISDQGVRMPSAAWLVTARNTTRP
jgi:SAM-dependent methyltransferase